MSSYDYAVEPTAFRDHRDLRYLLEKCGFHTGRFLVAFPAKWHKLVFAHLDRLPEGERKRAVELLIKYRSDRVFACDAPYESERAWVHNAAKLKLSGRVADAIAAGPNSAGLATIDDTSEDFFKAAERLIPASANEYVRIASRLIQSSARVVCVDPYFRLSRPFRKRVLEAFVKASARGRCREIHVICRERECWEKGYPGRLVGLLESIVDNVPLTLRVNFVDDSGSPYELHARYLVSALGAIQFDRGFEEAVELRYVPVAPVGRELHAALCRLYYDGEHGFKVVQSVIYPG